MPIPENTVLNTILDIQDENAGGNDPGYFVIGTVNDGTTEADILVGVLDADGGNSIDYKTFGSTSYDRQLSATSTSDGGIIISGYTYGYGSLGNENDMYISDSEGIISSIIYGPDKRTSITSSTKDVVFTVYGTAGISPEQINQHLEDISLYVSMISSESIADTIQIYNN
mgnify:CR=1 FL=1